MSDQGSILRIGVYGTAYWAENVHLPALAEAPGFRLAGVSGRNGARVGELASQFGIDAYDDFDTLLAHVDVVSFAVPPEVQAQLAPKAAGAGKHLILEKPVAMTEAAAEAIRAAICAAKVNAVCFLTRNFIPELKTFAEAARADGASTAHASFFSSALTEGSPYAGSQWRQKQNATLWDSGPHLLTSLANVLGPVAEITIAETGDGGLKGSLVHRNGLKSSFEVNQTRPLGPMEERLTVETVDGRKTFENRQYDRLAAFRAAAAQLLRAIAGDADARRAFDDAVEIVHVLASGERSLTQGGASQPIHGL